MRNMSKVSNWLYLSALSLALISCGSSDKAAAPKARVAGKLCAAPSTEVVLGRFDDQQKLVFDTLKTSADSSFNYQLDVLKGQPEFVYIITKENDVVSVLLNEGDDVIVDIDAYGNAQIKGSEESVKFMQLQKDFDSMAAEMNDLYVELDGASQSQAKAIRERIGIIRKNIYQSSAAYVMENCYSLTSIPVLYRTITIADTLQLPVFDSKIAPYLYKQIADSLETKYPESRYVKTLRDASYAGYRQLELQSLVDNADVAGYLDIELPGLDGKTKKLSDLDSKVILLYFWSSSIPGQNRFNVEVLKSIYDSYHAKGFDIFQVSLDSDKVQWATTVIGQELPWTNVCDTRAKSATVYNLQTLPSAFVICNGELVDGNVVDEAEFRKLLDKLLK